MIFLWRYICYLCSVDIVHLWKQMWIVFIRIVGILTGILEYSRYVCHILWHIGHIRITGILTFRHNFYHYLTMLSSILGRDDKIKLYDWSRIFKFSKKMISMDWCFQMRYLMSIQAFYPWESYTFPLPRVWIFRYHMV